MSRVEMPPTKVYPVPSEEFIVAISRYAGGAEGNPPVCVIGDTKMRDVMRAPNGTPSQVYFFEVDIYGDDKTGQNEHTITGVEKGLIAGEFIKTSDYGIADKNRTIKIEEGQGIVLVQKNATDTNGEIISDVVEEFKAIQITKEQEVVIPPGSFYLLVSTDRDNIFVVRHSGRSKNTSSSDNPNSQTLRDMGGFAFRVVANDSHVCLQPNKRYKEVNNLESGGIPLSSENLD